MLTIDGINLLDWEQVCDFKAVAYTPGTTGINLLDWEQVCDEQKARESAHLNFVSIS